MLTRTKDFLAFPNVKKVKRGTFFELASRHIIKSKKKGKTTLSQDIDSVLYGK